MEYSGPSKRIPTGLPIRPQSTLVDADPIVQKSSVPIDRDKTLGRVRLSIADLLEFNSN